MKKRSTKKSQPRANFIPEVYDFILEAGGAEVIRQKMISTRYVKKLSRQVVHNWKFRGIPVVHWPWFIRNYSHVTLERLKRAHPWREVG